MRRSESGPSSRLDAARLVSPFALDPSRDRDAAFRHRPVELRGPYTLPPESPPAPHRASLARGCERPHTRLDPVAPSQGTAGRGAPVLEVRSWVDEACHREPAAPRSLGWCSPPERRQPARIRRTPSSGWLLRTALRRREGARRPTDTGQEACEPRQSTTRSRGGQWRTKRRPPQPQAARVPASRTTPWQHARWPRRGRLRPET